MPLAVRHACFAVSRQSARKTALIPCSTAQTYKEGFLSMLSDVQALQAFWNRLGASWRHLLVGHVAGVTASVTLMLPP